MKNALTINGKQHATPQQMLKNQFFTKATTYLIIGFTLVSLFFGSCTKTNDDDDEQDNETVYKISFKLDGTLMEFADNNFPPRASFSDNGTQYYAQVSATGRSNTIGLIVYDTKAIEEKDYSGFVITPTTGSNTLYGAILTYTEGILEYSTESISNPSVHVEITEITANSVRGEFSGILRSQNGNADINITEGKFYAGIIE